MTVDVGLVELDRGESRLLDGSRGWSRGCRVCGGGDRRLFRQLQIIISKSQSGYRGSRVSVMH